MVYLKYVENVIPLSKLIGLLFLFCLPVLSILNKTKRNDIARPVMGTIFLVVIINRLQLLTTVVKAVNGCLHFTSMLLVASCKKS